MWMPHDGHDQRTSGLSAGAVWAAAASVRRSRSPVTCCSQLNIPVRVILQTVHLCASSRFPRRAGRGHRWGLGGGGGSHSAKGGGAKKEGRGDGNRGRNDGAGTPKEGQVHAQRARCCTGAHRGRWPYLVASSRGAGARVVLVEPAMFWPPWPPARGEGGGVGVKPATSWPP